MLSLADDALVSAQRMGEWIARVPADRGGRRARQHRARPARPGPLAADLRRLARGPGPHRGRPGLPPRRRATSATCTSSSASAATSGSRWPGCWCSRRTSASSTTGSRTRPTRPWPRSRPRRSRRSTTTATTPRCGCCASATAPTSRTADAGRPRRRVALRRRALRRLVRRPAARRGRGGRRPGDAARAFDQRIGDRARTRPR